MLAAERQAKIVEIIRRQGSAQVEDLAQNLQVSTMTIRRDLEKLQEDNLLERCHGGAVAKQEVAYAEKCTSHKEGKRKLAAACRSLVSDGDNIYLDAGTTTYEIAKVIQDVSDIMVVTNDLEIAGLLKNSPAEILLCGGVVQTSTGSMLGYYATQMLENFRFDVGFFGAASINEELEVSTPTVDKAFLKRMALERCSRGYLVVDESKFGKQAMAKVSHLADYTAVITDRNFTEEEKEEAKKSGVRIIRV